MAVSEPVQRQRACSWPPSPGVGPLRASATREVKSGRPGRKAGGWDLPRPGLWSSGTAGSAIPQTTEVSVNSRKETAGFIDPEDFHRTAGLVPTAGEVLS